MSQMNTVDRDRIEFLISLGWSLPKIAADLVRSRSTIRSELLGHRLDSDKHYGCSNRLCARYDECARTVFNGFKDVRRKNSQGYFESCPDFREAVCVRLNRAPYVCNGCERERNCPFRKREHYIKIPGARVHGAEGGSRLGHVKSDARRRLHHAAHRPVVTLPKRRKPEGRSRSGDRSELPHTATKRFA